MSNLSQLSDVISYVNPASIKQFCIENPEKTAEEAKQIFQDLLSWLWLAENRLKRQLATHMIAPLVKLDAMWHIFISHTQDYTEFCQTYFDRYLEHLPEPIGHEYAMTPDELSAFLEECYDYLGEGWLARNFL
jgi:hypothetical protein